MDRRWLNIAAGLAIPSAGTVVFNVLSEMVKGGAKVDIPFADWDFSFGCALAIVGVAVSQEDEGKARAAFVLFAAVLLILLVFDIILRYRWPSYEGQIIAVSDVLALSATLAAMWDL